jgi:hypothetical protein
MNFYAISSFIKITRPQTLWILFRIIKDNTFLELHDYLLIIKIEKAKGIEEERNVKDGSEKYSSHQIAGGRYFY